MKKGSYKTRRFKRQLKRSKWVLSLIIKRFFLTIFIKVITFTLNLIDNRKRTLRVKKIGNGIYEAKREKIQ